MSEPLIASLVDRLLKPPKSSCKYIFAPEVVQSSKREGQLCHVAGEIRCKDSECSENDHSEQVVNSSKRSCVLCNRSQKGVGKSLPSGLSSSFPHRWCLYRDKIFVELFIVRQSLAGSSRWKSLPESPVSSLVLASAGAPLMPGRTPVPTPSLRSHFSIFPIWYTKPKSV